MNEEIILQGYVGKNQDSFNRVILNDENQKKINEFLEPFNIWDNLEIIIKRIEK